MDNPEVEQSTQQLLAQWQHAPGNLLQMLVGLQHYHGHIPHDAIDLLAESLALSKTRIRDLITFYSFLHLAPRGQYDILISDNIIDQLQGSRQLAGQLADGLEMSLGTTRQDQRVSLNYTSCTGMPDQGPAALINGHAITRLTPARIQQMISLIEQQVALSQWPAALFQVSNPVQRGDRVLAASHTPGAAIRTALDTGSEAILRTLEAAGLRGCGGAGFRTATKWRLCAETRAQQHIVVCNADEGEPGTFKDRFLLQTHPGRVIDGMTLCAAVIGASTGFIYLRGEYRYLLEPLNRLLAKRRREHLLGRSILGHTGFDFDITIHLGAGAYICGEESALIESLEGRRGIPRNRPPFPVTAGYNGLPTVVNNVETLANAAMIVEHGSAWYRAVGTEKSPGTKLLSISGDCELPGVYEFPYGTTIGEILATCKAQPTQAVQIGGAAGRLIPPSEFDRQLAFEDLATGGSFMIFNQSRDLLQAIDNFSHFFQHESCGFCTPCRVGTTLLVKQLGKVMVGHATTKDLDEMNTVGKLMQQTSHCGLGQTAAHPILDGLAQFPGVFQSRLRSTSFEPAFDLDASLEEARAMTGRSDLAAHLKGGGV